MLDNCLRPRHYRASLCSDAVGISAASCGSSLFVALAADEEHAKLYVFLMLSIYTSGFLV
ncbi:MAG: hypothetical protein ACN4GR_00340 [Arenicellales bacterium]